jgi:hypothetical protein
MASCWRILLRTPVVGTPTGRTVPVPCNDRGAVGRTQGVLLSRVLGRVRRDLDGIERLDEQLHPLLVCQRRCRASGDART